MLNPVAERQKLRWYEAPDFLEIHEKEMERRKKHLLEIKESVEGTKEEFDISKYIRLRYHREPGVIRQDVAESLEEEYYLLHPEITTIQEFIDYQDLHEYDT